MVIVSCNDGGWYAGLMLRHLWERQKPGMDELATGGRSEVDSD